MRSSLFCVVMQRMLAVSYRRFGTACTSCFQGSSTPSCRSHVASCWGLAAMVCNPTKETWSQWFASNIVKCFCSLSHYWPTISHHVCLLFLISVSLYSIVFLFCYSFSNVCRLCCMGVKRGFYFEIIILVFLFKSKIEFGKERKREWKNECRNGWMDERLNK